MIGKPALEKVLEEFQINFFWNEDDKVWWLSGVDDTGKTWRTPLFPAVDRDEAEDAAIEHIKQYHAS